MGAKQFLGGAALGAGLVYFLDPERGAGRRAWAQARLARPTRVLHYGARAGDLQGLQAANLTAHSGRGDTGQLARIAGGALALYGLLKRGKQGALLRTLGLSLAATTRSAARPLGERRRAVDIQKSLRVDAPVERVFAFWTSYDNFPLFITNVRQVEDLGHGRSRWVLSGPGQRPIEWEALVTAREEHELLAWRSEPGSVLEHAGALRMTPENGGTRLDLRICYYPPSGRAGRTVAGFFGGDPRARLNEDLARLKSLLETTTRSTSHGQEPRT